MLKSWFTCRVKYTRQDSDGKDLSVTEAFLIDAYSYTEAESRTVQIMTEEGYAPFHVANITKNNFAEVFQFEDADKWFKVKVALIIYDEQTSKEKQSNQYFMVTALDVKDAYDKVVEKMKGTMADFVIPSISYTKIVDVFPLSESEHSRNQLIEKGFTPLTEALQNASAISASLSSFANDMNDHVDEETGEIQVETSEQSE